MLATLRRVNTSTSWDARAGAQLRSAPHAYTGGMTDLNAAIRAKVHEVSQRLDDDCNMQCGVSCASQGYDDITRGLLAALDVHRPEPYPPSVAGSLCAECREAGPGYEAESTPYPCPTVLAIAKAFEIEP